MQLAILLGASEFESNVISDNDGFLKSKTGFKIYLRESNGFALSDEDILDLFDSTKNATDQVRSVLDFVRERSPGDGDDELNVIMYYVGHGYYSENRTPLYLALRSTDYTTREASGLLVKNLADALSRLSPNINITLIVDSCFSADVAKQLMSLNYVAHSLEAELRTLPDIMGVSVLCSSTSDEYSHALEDEKGTLFSSALLSVLTGEWGKNSFEKLSLSEICSFVITKIESSGAKSISHPQVFDPKQRNGRLSDTKLFPVIQKTEGISAEQSDVQIDAGQTLLAHQLEIAGSKYSEGVNETLSNLASFEDTYWHKLRIKPAKDIVDKVHRKMAIPRSIPYTVESVTDVVGIRLITIFRKELIGLVCEIVKTLLVEASLVPNNLYADEVLELKVYTTAVTASASGFAEQVVANIHKITTDLDVRLPEIKIEYRNEYSSIHITYVKLVDVSSRERIRLPVELQIRTVFEDAWATIDHKLRYSKTREKREQKGSGVPVASEKHLVTLKALLDAMSEFVETISEEISSPAMVSGQYITAIDGAVAFTEEAKSLGVPDVLIQEIGQKLAEKDSYDQEFDELSSKPASGDATRKKRLKEQYGVLAEALRRVIDRESKPNGYFQASNLSEEPNANVYYTVTMEEAYCRLSTGKSDEIALGETLYANLCKVFPNSPILHFRYGQALGRLKRYSEAIVSFEEALVLSKTFEDSDAFGWLFTDAQRVYFDATVYRLLGFSYWMEFERISEAAGVNEAAAIQLNSAWHVTKSGLDKVRNQRDTIRLLNNLIWFFDTMMDLEEDLRKTAMEAVDSATWIEQKFIELKDGVDVSLEEHLEVLDTLNVISRRSGDIGYANDVSKRILDLTNSEDARYSFPEEAMHRAQRNAWETLKDTI